MKQKGLTIEIMEKRLKETGDRCLPSIFNKYFDEKKIEDPQRPSKEIAEWFFKNLCRSYGYSGEMFNLLEQGYINFSQIIELDCSDMFMNSTRSFLALLVAEKGIAADAKEMKMIFGKIPHSRKEEIAKGILTLNIRMHNCIEDRDLATMKENFIKVIEGCFSFLLQQIEVNDHSLWMWRNCAYIPTTVIKREFNNSFMINSEYERVGGRFQEHVRRFNIPIEQTLELVDFFRGLPQAGTKFPYCKNIGVEVLIDSLEQGANDLGRCTPDTRRKIYNMFIKPLQSNPELFTSMFEGFSYGDGIRGLARLGGAVVPASEVVTFIKTILEPLFNREGDTYSAAKFVAEVKTNSNQPVTKEFILYQIEKGIRGSALCLNNSCISNLNFWINIAGHNSSRFALFQNGLQHNESFKKWFKLDIEDLDFYRENKRNIAWSSFFGLSVFPKEFIKEFSEYLPMSRLSNEVLASFGEEELSYYLNTPYCDYVPYNFLAINHNISIPFMAENAMKLLRNRNAIEFCPHISLVEMVAALA